MWHWEFAWNAIKAFWLIINFYELYLGLSFLLPVFSVSSFWWLIWNFLQIFSFWNFCLTIVFWDLCVLELKSHACMLPMLKIMLFLSLSFFCYKVVSFYAIWQKILYYFLIFLLSFKNGDVFELIKALRVFFCWITGLNCMKQRFSFYVLLLHGK